MMAHTPYNTSATAWLHFLQMLLIALSIPTMAIKTNEFARIGAKQIVSSRLHV